MVAKRTDFIWQYILKKCAEQGGVPPTVREIKAECRLSSTSVVNYHINKLIDAGKIEKLSERRWCVVNAEWKAPA